MTIYHIVLPEVWKESAESAFYEAESLSTEGFIHCSFANQLEGVLKRYYSGVSEVVVLEIETEKLTSKLVNEPSTRDEIYPHIYGKINLNSVINSEKRKIL